MPEKYASYGGGVILRPEYSIYARVFMTIQTIFEFVIALVALIILHELGISSPASCLELKSKSLDWDRPPLEADQIVRGLNLTFNWLLLRLCAPEREKSPSTSGGIGGGQPLGAHLRIPGWPANESPGGRTVVHHDLRHIGDVIPEQVQIVVPAQNI